MAAVIRTAVSRLSPIAIVQSGLPAFSWLTRASAGEAGTQIAWDSIGSAEGDLRSYIASVKRDARAVVFGENHHQPRVLAAQLMVLDELLKPPAPRLHALVLEAFTVVQQVLLDAFHESWQAQETEQQTQQAVTKLIDDYEHNGGDVEGFDLSHYMPLFILAREHRVRLVGGFPPRPWARIRMKEGVTPELRRQLDEIGFDGYDQLDATPEHAAYIKSLVSGEQPVVQPGQPASGLVQAQLLKDAVMASTVNKTLRESNNGSVMVICGSGHCEYAFGVPERIRAIAPKQVKVVVTKPHDEGLWKGVDWGKEEDARKVADAIVLYEAV